MVYHVCFRSAHSERVLSIEARNFAEACKIAEQESRPYEAIHAIVSSKYSMKYPKK